MVSAMTAVRVGLHYTLHPLPIGEVSLSSLTDHTETAAAIHEAWEDVPGEGERGGLYFSWV